MKRKLIKATKNLLKIKTLSHLGYFLKPTAHILNTDLILLTFGKISIFWDCPFNGEEYFSSKACIFFKRWLKTENCWGYLLTSVSSSKTIVDKFFQCQESSQTLTLSAWMLVFTCFTINRIHREIAMLIRIRSNPKLLAGSGYVYGSRKKSFRIHAASDPKWIWSKTMIKIDNSQQKYRYSI